jgi:hypothetical protein
LEPARREDDHGRDADPERAEEVGEDVAERRLDVEAASAPIEDAPAARLTPIPTSAITSIQPPRTSF